MKYLEGFQKRTDDLIFMLTRMNWEISRGCVEQFAALLDHIKKGGLTKSELLTWMTDQYSFVNGKSDAELYWDGVLSKVLCEAPGNILKLKPLGEILLLAEKVLGKRPIAAILRFVSHRKGLRGPFVMFMLTPPQYLWFIRNAGKDYFLRTKLQDDVHEFIKKEVPRFHQKYVSVDAIVLFSGGPDSMFATLAFARDNPDKKVLLVTFYHHFHSCNYPSFLEYYKSLTAPEKNIIGIEPVDITDLFNSISYPFRERYFSEKLRPCITCKMLMAYLVDILLESYKSGVSGEKYMVTGYRGPERKTLFPQTKRFDEYAKRVIQHANYVSPIWEYFDKKDVYEGLEKMGIKGYNRHKGIECSGPLTWDQQKFRYGWNDFKLLEDIVGLLNSLDRKLG